MTRTLNILKVWLPLAVITIGLSGLVYLTAQQSIRQGLNDPQVQMAQDAAAALSQGTDPMLPAAKVDAANSLAPFLILYDDSGSLVAASVELHGETPILPSGVLDYTRTNGEDRLTWQPETGVRIAAVVVRYEGVQSGFVLAGRNMREGEARIDQFGQITLLAMLVTLAASLLAVAFGEFFLQNKKSN